MRDIPTSNFRDIPSIATGTRNIPGYLNYLTPDEPKVQEPSFSMRNFPGTLEHLADLQVDPFSLKEDSRKVISDYFSGIKDSILGAGEALSEAGGEVKGGTMSGTIGKSLQAGSRILGAVISPISSAFQAAENIPGWGSAAKLINTAFSALGEGTTGISNTVIDKLPIDEKTKENLKPGIAEALSLATQILAAGAVEGAFRIGKPKVEELTNKYGKQDAQTIIEKAVEIAKEQKSPQVETKPGQIRLYEDKVPTPEKLPKLEIIQVGPTTKIVETKIKIARLQETLEGSRVKDLIKYANSKGELPGVVGYGKSEFVRRGDQIVTEYGFKSPEEAQVALDSYFKSRKELRQLAEELRQAKGETFRDYSPEDLDRINALASEAQKSINVIEPEPLRPIGGGEIQTSGLAQGVEFKAIENKLTQGFGDLPEYQRVNMMDQARLADSLLKKDPALARDIALGRRQAPQGILPEAIFIAMENFAIKGGDVTTLRELATQSGLTLEATAMGQRIRTLAERNPDSPVSAMHEIVRARMEKVKDPVKVKNKIKEEIRKEIKKPTKEDWGSFVDSLIC